MKHELLAIIYSVIVGEEKC